MLLLSTCPPDQESESAHTAIRSFLHLPGGFVLPKDSTGRPLPIGHNHYSISHKSGIFFAGIDSAAIGVDIERIAPRDESLFSWHTREEYEVLRGMDWKSFYILWTTKEAIIKRFGGILDDTKRVALRRKRDIMRSIDSLDFSLELQMTYGSQDVTVLVGFRDDLIYSFTAASCENTGLS